MSIINVEKECGCFKKSPYENNQKFNSKDDALLSGQAMVNNMNDTFCQTHQFKLQEDGDNLKISVDMRESSNDSGCCGGGHCS